MIPDATLPCTSVAIPVSVPTLIVPRMQDEDAIDPGDVALQELLATVAERTTDPSIKSCFLTS